MSGVATVARPATPASAMTCGMPSPRESQTKTSSAARRRGTSARSPRKSQRAVEAERGREGAELVGVVRHEGVGAADDEEAGGGLGGVDEGGGAEEVLDALLAVEAADPADEQARPGGMPRARRTAARAPGSNSAGSTIEGISTAWRSRPGMRLAAASRMVRQTPT